MRIILLLAAAKLVPEVLIIFISATRFLPAHFALLPGLLVNSKSTGVRLGKACSSAIAYKITLREKFHEFMFAVTGDGAGVAYPSRRVWLGGYGRGWIAGQT